jgi:hypothetical protein
LSIPHVFALSLRGRREPDAAIQQNHPASHRIAATSPFVIARSVATRQSSDRLGIPMFLRCHCEEGVSLTRQSSGTIRHSPVSPATSHVVIARSEATRQSSDRLGIPHVFALSLRGAQRRGNPAEPSGIPPYRPGIPHGASDWIATSVLFETFLAMT